jgi:hypothetical protein
MANFNVTIPVNQIVDVAWPGTPFPNSGVSFVSVTPATTGCTQYLNILPHSLQIKGTAVGTAVITVTTQNAVGTHFTDTIDVTVINSQPDATDSGMTISAPHA